MHLGTLFYTRIMGEQVGVDEFSNRYYRSRGRRLQGRERRWVLYKGRVEASKVPPEWHAWLHHTTDAPLTENAVRARPWQKEHMPNPTGTRQAYLPGGHDLRGGAGRRLPAITSPGPRIDGPGPRKGRMNGNDRDGGVGGP